MRQMPLKNQTEELQLGDYVFATVPWPGGASNEKFTVVHFEQHEGKTIVHLLAEFGSGWQVLGRVDKRSIFKDVLTDLWMV